MENSRPRPRPLAYINIFLYLCTRIYKHIIMLGFSSTQEKELRLRHKSTVRRALAQRQAGVVTDEDLVQASFDKEPANVVLCK